MNKTATTTNATATTTNTTAATMATWHNNSATFCWGNMSQGQLGLGGIEEEQIYSPRELLAIKGRGVLAVAVGVDHSLFILDDALLYSCGSNDYGQLGHDKSRRRPGVITYRVNCLFSRRNSVSNWKCTTKCANE